MKATTQTEVQDTRHMCVGHEKRSGSHRLSSFKRSLCCACGQSTMMTGTRTCRLLSPWWMGGPRASRGTRESSCQASPPALSARCGCSLPRPNSLSAHWPRLPGTSSCCPTKVASFLISHADRPVGKDWHSNQGRYLDDGV